jgi:hypothetical protein
VSRDGSKQIAIRLLNAFGITESYDSVLGSIKGLDIRVREAILAFIQDGRWFVAYDNLDISIDTHEQTTSRYFLTIR